MTKTKDVFAWQFDPLEPSARVQVTLNGVAIAEVQSIKSAGTICRRMNAFPALVAALEHIMDLSQNPHIRSSAGAALKLAKAK